MSEETWAWIDGVVGPAQEGVASPIDRGLLLAQSVYDTCAVVDGQPYALTRHFDRLRRSAGIIDIEFPWSNDELRLACDRLLVAAQSRERPAAAPHGRLQRLRLTVTGGSGPLGVGPHDGPPSLLVLLGPSRSWDPMAAVATVSWELDEHRPSVGAKVATIDNLLALAAARRTGADEAVMANRAGALCEGTGSNVFVVVDGALLTPSLSTGCLPGVTRELVMEVVARKGLAGGEVEERTDLSLEGLRSASEAFLTSATRNVHPVRSVDGRNLGGCPGPLTEQVRVAFEEFRSSTPDP